MHDKISKFKEHKVLQYSVKPVKLNKLKPEKSWSHCELKTNVGSRVGALVGRAVVD